MLNELNCAPAFGDFCGATAFLTSSLMRGWPCIRERCAFSTCKASGDADSTAPSGHTSADGLLQTIRLLPMKRLYARGCHDIATNLHDLLSFHKRTSEHRVKHWKHALRSIKINVRRLQRTRTMKARRLSSRSRSIPRALTPQTAIWGFGT